MIPEELKALPQWAVSTLAVNPSTGKPDKAPRQVNGLNAKVNDPSTWCTYQEAAAAAEANGWAVGFMLTPGDPYVVIDLDHDPAAPLSDEARARQQMIFETCADTYAELSQSGLGLHIIARGKIGGGIRRKGVEVYDQYRYIVCTGNVVRDKPIADYSADIGQLVENLGGLDAPGGLPHDYPEVYTDEEILHELSTAANAEKFKRLFYMRPEEGDDWSQWDAALAQMIAFRTRNHEQALRLFRRSQLYRGTKGGYNTTEKYEQGYLLGHTFKKAWQHEAVRYYHIDKGAEYAAILLDNFRREQQAKLEAALSRAAENPPAQNYPETAPKENSVPCPPGLVGQVAQYVYHTSPSPVWEIAMAVSLTFCSAVFGNRWRTPTGNGLGHYTVLLAESGTGKTAAVGRINALVRAIEDNGSALIKNLTGPGFIASGQGLLKRFAEQPVMYAYLSEFDATLQRLDPDKAIDSYIELRRVLLEVFDADRIQATAYAKKEDSTAVVDHPVFSFMGDTRADDFFRVVNDQFARSGFLARLTLIEYRGPIVPTPKNYHPHVPQDLVHAINDAVLACDRQRSGVATVAMEPAAAAYYTALDEERVRRMNDAGDELTKGAWNRFNLRVLRLASVLAVGCSPAQPVVTQEHMQWAEGVVRWGLERTLGDRVRSGKVGEADETQFEGDVVEWVEKYRNATPAQRTTNMKAPKALAERDDVFPYASFKEFVKWRAFYKNHRGGFQKAADMALEAAKKSGLIDQLTVDQCRALGYSGRMPVFALGEHWGG